MRPTRFIAIDCGASRVTCAGFATGEAGVSVVQRLAMEPHRGVRASLTEWLTETGRALAALQRREKLPGEAWVVVPGHLTLVKFIRTPAIAAASRARIIEFEAAQSLPLPLGELAWDHALLAQADGELEIMLAAARREVIEGLGREVTAKGWRVGGFVPAGVALAAGLRASPNTGDAPLLHIEIGARTSQLLFWHAGRFVVRAVLVGGVRLTELVAQRLAVDFAAAETAKRRVLGGEGEPAATETAAVAAAIAEWTEQLRIEVMRTIVGGVRRAGLAPPEVLRLTGGGSASPAIHTAISERLKLRLETVGRLPGTGAGEVGGVDLNGALLALNGLAAVARGGSPTIDLSPPAWRTERVAGRRRRHWLAAAVLLALALFPPAIQIEKMAARAEQQRREAEAELAPVRRQARVTTARVAEWEDLKLRIRALEDRQRTRSRWVRLLADLEQRFATIGDVWIDRLGVANREGVDGDIRLRLVGRMLDPATEEGGREVVQRRVGQLLASLAQSEFVAAVEPEQFEIRDGRVLEFAATLALRAGW